MTQIAQTLEIKGQRMVLLEEGHYFKLLEKAGLPTPELRLPSMPEKLPSGNYPALEYARASLARDIIRTRRRLGLSQAELARRAGMAPEVLNRIERAKTNPSVAVVEKIDRALRAAEKR